MPPISIPYLLATGVPSFVDASGRRWLDDLWHKDLREHLEYIKNLTLAAPRREGSPPSNAKCLDDDRDFAGVHYVDLKASDSLLSGLWNLPTNFVRLWYAVGRARIVHTGLADWPIPTGWSATLIAKLRRKDLLIIVESAFWRASKNASLSKKVRAWIWERVNRLCLRQASLAIFTHRGYLDDLLPNGQHGLVHPASWIDAKNVLADTSARAIWDKRLDQSRLSLLFAGRLVAEKGILDLLQAMEGLPKTITLDVIGSGGLVDAVRRAAELNDAIRLLAPVEYGADFFKLVGKYDAVIVPSQTDEQPRIVYDAYSQAVPVIATRTKGNSECVLHERTGYLVEAEDLVALRAAICRAAAERATLRTMGMSALMLARDYTHQEMHRRRWVVLRNLIDGNARSPQTNPE